MTALEEITAHIYPKNNLQRKHIEAVLEDQDNRYFQDCEFYCGQLLEFLRRRDRDAEFAADAYLSLVADMVSEKRRYIRSGSYSCPGMERALEEIYSAEERMLVYMTGLYLSTFLWPNHYSIYRFFQDTQREWPSRFSHLEIGPGHGLYLIESMRAYPQSSFRAMDISQTSLDMTRDLAALIVPDGHIDYERMNVVDLSGGPFDQIVMGEVLEHVEDPLAVLRSIRNTVSDSGRFFMTTCANSPAIDHVYHFKSVEEIRDMCGAAGFDVVSELILPVGEDGPSGQEINYAADLMKVTS